MSATLYAYIRVSAKDQNQDRQLIAILKYGVLQKNIFMDKQSGKDFNRPAYLALRDKLKAGDQLIVKSIDRLGRNYQEVMEQWRYLTKEVGADITVLDMPMLDTTKGKDLLGTFISDLVLQLLSFVAENERDNIRRRQAEGIAAAKARGVKWGKEELLMPVDFEDHYRAWMDGTLSIPDFAKLCGCCQTTLFKNIKNFRTTHALQDPKIS